MPGPERPHSKIPTRTHNLHARGTAGATWQPPRNGRRYMP